MIITLKYLLSLFLGLQRYRLELVIKTLIKEMFILYIELNGIRP